MTPILARFGPSSQAEPVETSGQRQVDDGHVELGKVDLLDVIDRRTYQYDLIALDHDGFVHHVENQLIVFDH